MKKILIISTILGCVSQVSMASNTGFYAGINLGASTTQSVPTLSIDNGINIQSGSGLALGLLGGYNFNKF